MSLTCGSHLRLCQVQGERDAAPWWQVGARAAYANEPAAPPADWLARIPAALQVWDASRVQGPGSARSPRRASRVTPRPGRARRLVNLGALPFLSMRVLVVNSSRVQDDDPTPRPAVQAEDGISPKGTLGALT
jgi:hypothetical protein